MYETPLHRTTEGGVRAEGLGKRYGDLWALRDLDLAVAPGSVLGLLGHNGAGKTTTTRTPPPPPRPTAGRASVAGLDVVDDAPAVRRRIGVAGQAATVDGLLSGRKNLEMVGRLYGLRRGEARSRAAELLERLRLTDAADKLVKDYSGGMRRRVDLAASLIARPPVLFLDEPTTGLDPQGRSELWEMLRAHVRDGMTLVLTTQYLEEADRLADEIVVLDHGRVAAAGRPSELKARYGGDRIDVTLSPGDDVSEATAALAAFADGRPLADEDAGLVTAPVRSGTRLIEVVRALDAAGVDATDVHRRDATLDDVFLALTTDTEPVPTP